MADHFDETNQQSNNPAFIANLLEKLRQQMADETDADESDDTAVSSVASAGEAASAAPAATEATPPASAASPAETTAPPETTDTASATVLQPVASVAAAISAQTPGAVPDAEATASPAASQPLTPSTEANDVIVDSVVGDQYAMSFTEPLYEGEVISPRSEPRQTLSTTILPESGRISESARHPVDERYRNMYDAVATAEAPPTADPDQYTMQLDAVDPDMPVPDTTPVAPSPLSVAQEPSVTVAEIPVGGEETPMFAASMWDTPGTQSQTQRDASTTSPIADFSTESYSVPVSPPSATAATEPDTQDSEPPAFHATARAKRESLADVDFDAVRDSDILREKVLLEPLESIGGEHSELQIERWQQELVRRRRGARARSIIAGILVALLAVFELVRPLTDWLLGALLITRVPGVVSLIDLQLLILVCLVGYRPLYRGFAALRFRRVIPETLASFAALVCLVGGTVFYLADVSDRYLFALTGAVVVLVAVLMDFFRAESLVHTFRAYAAPDAHFGGVLTRAHDHRLIRDLYPEGMDPVLMETEPVSQVEGYIATTRERVEGRRSSLISLCVAVFVAVVTLVTLLVLERGVPFSFWCALLSFVAVLPLSLFAVHRYLTRMLTSRISDERIGVTGESAVYRYADCGVMSFADTEAFPKGSVHVKGIKLCGDFHLDKALYLVSSLFDRVGGPLNSVFRISTADVRISDDVEIRSLAPEGIEAQVNHEDVCVGTRAYLEGIGVEIFRDIEDERAEEDGSRVLYVAYRGILCTKFYVKYEISTAFEKNVEYYAKHGVSSVIVTADPLMDNALLDHISYISDYDVRFVKRDITSLQEEKNIPRAVELISYGPRKTLRRMPFFFKRYVSLQRLAFVFGMIGMGISALAAPLLLTVVPVESALFAFLLQLLAFLPTIIVGVVVRRMNPNP